MPLQTMAWDKIPGRGGGALDVRTGVLEAIIDEAYIWEEVQKRYWRDWRERERR